MPGAAQPSAYPAIPDDIAAQPKYAIIGGEESRGRAALCYAYACPGTGTVERPPIAGSARTAAFPRASFRVWHRVERSCQGSVIAA